MERVLLTAALFLVACGGDEGTNDTASTAPTGEAAFKGAPLTEPSDGECPNLNKSGETRFSSGGAEREMIVRMPKDPPEGLPVIFFWHGLGDSAAGIDGALDLGSVARKNDVIIVVPQSTAPALMTWDIFNGGADTQFYDDMRTCLVRELGADISRITTTGFSFGALFSTRLVLDRADTLAAAATLSGGTDSGIGLTYSTPAHDTPVMVMYGSDADAFDAGVAQVNFREASQDFAGKLEADGHVVTQCDHGLGHTLPMDFGDALWPWLLDHTYGEPSPYSGGLEGFPDYCF